MLIGAIVLASLITAFWVAAPLLRPRDFKTSRVQRSALELQRERLLGELKELEFDRRMGKIEIAEYTPLRAELAARAAQVLKRIEAEREEKSMPETKSQTRNSVRKSVANWDADIEIEVLIARARYRLTAGNVQRWTCECGRAMSESDRFCASCGVARPTVAIV